MAEKVTNIGGRLHDTSSKHTVTGANEILDDDLQKKQSVINAEQQEFNQEQESINEEIDNRLDSHDAAIADRYTKDEVNNIVSRTPETDVIVIEVPAASQSDIAGWLDANTPSDIDPETGRSVRSNKLYRVPGPTNQTYSEWAWDGTKYICLAHKDYGIDNKPIKDSTNLISSGGVFPVMERALNNSTAISEVSTLTPSEINEGFYYDDGPRTVPGWAYYKYSVSPSNEYLFSSYFPTDTDIWFVYWLNSIDEIIYKEPYRGNSGAGSPSVTYIDQPVIAPDNAAYMVLNMYPTSGKVYGLKSVGELIFSSELKSELEINSKNIEESSNNINALASNISISQLDNLIAESTVTGKFIYDNGTEGENGNFSYLKFSVSEKEMYTFSGGFYDASIHFVHWYDENDNYLGHSFYAGREGGAMVRYVDKPVIAPEYAAYALLNIQTADVPNNIYNFKHVVAQSEKLEDLRKDLRTALSKKTELEILNPSEGVGKFYYDDGPRENQYFTYYKYAVEPNRLYTFSSHFGGDTDIPFVYWLNADGNVVGRESYHGNAGAGSEPVTYVDQPIIANSDAAFVVINRYNDQAFATNVKAIGDICDFMAMRGTLPSCDLNDVKETGTWLLADHLSYQHVPDGSSLGFLRVSNLDNWFLQEFYTFDGASLYKRKFHGNAQMAEDWALISGGGSVTNNYTFNEYSQTVDLDCSPAITADTNNYLASTNDTTDRTSAILAMLQSTGICHLGPGEFWVDGLIMPDDSSLIGSGTATKVYLKSGTNKFAVKMASRCIVKDMHIQGSASNIDWSIAGTRVGILWQGNYTQQQSDASQPKFGTIESVYLSRFDNSGIKCYDTGYGTHNYISVTNCHIWNSHIGINVEYWSEFNKFTNVRCAYCYYGCVNNGGNNVFVNCDFSSSTYVAFLMDNSQSQSINNSHGSCVGCVFNHTAGNSGDGIKILNCESGFVFDGCQIFFSKIHIEDSDGISVVASNFGYSNCDISVSGGGAVLFANNMHQGVPPITITNNNKTHFVNCYVRSTGEVVTA